MTENSGIGCIGSYKKLVSSGWMILWELPVSINLVTTLPCIQPGILRVRGAWLPMDAVSERWKNVWPLGSGGEVILGGIVNRDVGGGGNGGKVVSVEYWFTSSGSSHSSKRNYFPQHLWSWCHLSSQLKHKPFAILACISVGESLRMGKSGASGGLGCRDGLLGGGVEGNFLG